MKRCNTESRRSFIKRSTGAATALMIPGLSLTESFEVKQNSGNEGIAINDNAFIKTGFAEVDVSPEIGMEQPSGYGKLYHTKFHDPCKVRASVFDDGTNRAAIVGIDVAFIPEWLVESVRKKVESQCGIPGNSIMISASHSHSSGPAGMIYEGDYDHANSLVRELAYENSTVADPRYMDIMENGLVEAICKADSLSAESVMGVGTGIENKVSFNRRFRMKDGRTYTHPGQGNPNIIEPAGPKDPEVGVVGAWNKEGKCTGCIVNFACHATTNPGGISANYIYYLEQTIRGAMGPDCIVVFLPGASGDVTQVDNQNPYKNLAGEEWARFVGGRIGAEAVKVLLSMPRGTVTPVRSMSKILKIDRRKPDPERVKKCYDIVKQSPEVAGKTEWSFAKEIVLLDAMIEKSPAEIVEVHALQIGPALFIANPAELFCQLGLDIKKKSPFKYTFPVCLANGYAGYVPTKESFSASGGGYETRLTSYSNLDVEAGNMIVEAGAGLARTLTPAPEPEFAKAPPFSGKPWEYGNVKPELK
ncbi:MAG: hypothetical protein PHG29_10355 [Prolixibacteraceae bacterium]|nr:hypothetical protein [Prolixibacteraceae bacterium]